MVPDPWKIAIRLTVACVACAIVAGSFVMGYYIGYSQAWDESVALDRFTFNAVQEYLKNNSGQGGSGG